MVMYQIPVVSDHWSPGIFQYLQRTKNITASSVVTHVTVNLWLTCQMKWDHYWKLKYQHFSFVISNESVQELLDNTSILYYDTQVGVNVIT